MDLAQSIKQYYFDHIYLLPEDKRFHFTSRLAAWQGERQAYKLLEELRSFMVPSDSQADLTKMLADIISTPPKGKRNAHELRQPFFQKYPLLWGAHAALFRVRHLQYVYNIDARSNLLRCIEQEKLDQMADELISDRDALRILSTFAVNFLYLYKHILLGQKNFIRLQDFIDIGQGYDLDNKKQMQLLIYLFTHCIIGETNFYTEDVPKSRIGYCREMLARIEKIILNDFHSINLDNKLEFLVCARICDYQTPLFEKIFDECAKSLSEEGKFLIDAHNLNAQADRETFEKSEHRNVLFIMSASPYWPRKTLLPQKGR